MNAVPTPMPPPPPAIPAAEWLERAFTSWNGRTVDTSRPVKMYRCLAPHGGRYSIHQNGRVVGHTDTAVLADVTFVVSAPGYRRRLRLGHRLVYAYVSGWLVDGFFGVRFDSHDKVKLGVPATLYGDAFRHCEEGPSLARAEAVALRTNMQVRSAAYNITMPQEAR